MLAAVRVRGLPDTPRKVSDTLQSLNLDKKHTCVLLEDTPSNRGMLEAVRNYVAFGEVSDDTVSALEADKAKPYRLSPPSKGFRNPKRGYNQGGSLGERDDMDELLGRMV